MPYADLFEEVAWLFRREADAIVDQYAWPPRAPLTAEERNEVDRLETTSKAIYYRSLLARCP